jgi:hypothetical protein
MKQRGKETHYVVCLGNEGYRSSLVVRKIYRILPDSTAAKHKLLRVIDETGEDYLYPEKLFTAVELPRAAGRIFSIAP